jgi:hypothetical protein
MPLLRPGADPRKSDFCVHDIPGQGSVLCYDNGIIEPITLSLFSILSHEGESAQSWLEEAARRNCYPLLARLDVALRELAKLAEPRKAAWAKTARDSLVGPGMKRLFEASAERVR